MRQDCDLKQDSNLRQDYILLFQTADRTADRGLSKGQLNEILGKFSNSSFFLRLILFHVML